MNLKHKFILLIDSQQPRCPYCGEQLTHMSGTKSNWFCERCEEV